MLNILIDMPIVEERLEQLHNIPGVNVEIIPFRETSEPLPATASKNFDIIFCTFPPINLHDCPSIRLIQISSVGYNQLVQIGLAEQGVKACNGQGIFDVPIAEWNMGMIFQLARNMRGMYRNQEQKVWDRSALFQTEIRGSKLGIWGYGGIGRETTRLAKAMGMHVQVLVRDAIKPREQIYCVPGVGDPEGILPDLVFTEDQETEFLQDLDFLILAVPLTNHTEGMIGERQLRALPPTAYILNPSRGPIIQEAALLRALREQWIAGAALDTHYYYPMPPEHPLWEFPNVIMTPHISGSSQSTHFLERIWSIFIENVKRLANNEPLLNELSSRQLQGE
ncbi:D-2-hydroxyacid dehydrogenase [Paenibacillus psychroresistens]|uniref:D-2-hydroxyacid dehydrogenase n=1 Tax=Paenibacillus psychroresistens TaxID=1778678 RepID=A0A6B8RJK1_9BACL|nr:D-2-hydroxyacid dehydrogenase [Paenibacillus psychroresistens]QGQ95576.1 D-2-hydroxyacid dehydrogenase [Paenibacillus psychroresistens]